MRTFKIVIISLVLIFLLVIGYLLFGNYSEGTRAGVVIKLSKKGWVFKTYEGQLNVGGYTDNAGTMMPQQWEFTVRGGNDEVIKVLEDAQLNGKRVKLYYKEKFYKYFWLGDTKYYVYKADVMK
jgi:hypothetical protein